MGLTWSLINVADARANMADWCEKAGVDLSQATEEGRNPKPGEVRSVLNSLEHYQAVYFTPCGRSAIHAMISSAITPDEAETFPTADIQIQGEIIVGALQTQGAWSTNVNVYAPDDIEVGSEAPHQFCFGKGHLELNIVITEKLSRICGSFILFEGCYGPYLIPVLVNPGDTNPREVIERWKKTYQQYGKQLEVWLEDSCSKE